VKFAEALPPGTLTLAGTDNMELLVLMATVLAEETV
jgi:hypothetical protein